jgi:hypothetical protein
MATAEWLTASDLDEFGIPVDKQSTVNTVFLIILYYDQQMHNYFTNK